MPTARIASIKVEVEEAPEDWHDFLGTEEDVKDVERQWVAGVRGYYHLLVTVNVVTRSGRLVQVHGSLAGIDLLSDTSKHRQESSEYLEYEAKNIYTGELRPELIKDFHVPAKEVDRAYRDFDWGSVG